MKKTAGAASTATTEYINKCCQVDANTPLHQERILDGLMAGGQER